MAQTNTKTGSFNSLFLKKVLKLRISTQFQQIAGQRCIYADTNIIQILNFIYDFKFESQGLANKIYQLQQDHQAADISNAPNIVFFIYPNAQLIESIASMIIKNELVNNKKNYYLYFVPLINYLCMEKLEAKQIKNKVRIRNFNFDMIPFNEDLYSLQFNKYMDPLEEDACVLQSFLKIFKIVGKIKNSFAIGSRSTKILNKLDTTIQEMPQIQDSSQQSFLIVLDRSLDYITPMLTAFSYEGLLDLFFGIKFNKIQVPGHLIDSKKPLQTFLLYNAKDRFYKKIASMYIKQVPEYLRSQSQQLHALIKQKKDKCSSLDQINQLNQNLIPEMHILQYHKSIVAFILTHINDNQFFNTATAEAQILQTCQRQQDIEYLSVFYPIQQVLKLQVLASQVSNFGNYFSRFQKKIYQYALNSYHPRHIYTIKNLVDKGILRSSKQPLKWKQICQRYDLIPDQPRCYTYIHTIYSALLVRFVQMFLTDNLNNDTTNLLSTQYIKKGNFKKIRSGDKVYIYIVGGITYPEIEAFRLLGSKLKINFILCTTQITSGQKIIKRCF